MSQEHRYDMSQLEKEEATMEAEDVLEAKLDQQKADYIQELLTESVRSGFHNCTFTDSAKFSVEATSYQPAEKTTSRFQFDVWRDWFDSLDNNLIELVRLNLACGDREKAGMVLVESLEEYMDEIAARAVRKRNNDKV